MTILTNEITLQVNHSAIVEDFFVYEVLADNLKGEQFKITLSNIYQNTQPLSLIIDNRKIYILCKDKLKERAHYANFRITSLQKTDLSALSDRTIARLLIHALPQLKHEGCSQGLGLYYLNDSKTYNDKKGIKFNYYYTFKFDIEPLTHDKQKSVITIKGQSLTPRAYHTNKDGTYPAKIARLPSISINPYFALFRKDKFTKHKIKQNKLLVNNDYVERAIRSDRMTSEMLSLDTKKPDKFKLSKIGRLAEFNNDITNYLNDYLTINWQSMPADYHKFFSNNAISRQYDKVAEILKTYDFYLVLNEPLSSVLADELIQHLNEVWGSTLRFTEGLQPFSASDSNSINLLIHHDKSYYKERNLPDPYQQAYDLTMDYSVLKQSLTLQTLISDKKTLNKPAIDNAMTEVFIKLEVMLGKLLLVRPKQNWRCVTARYIKSLNPDEKSDKFEGFNILDYYNNDHTLYYQQIHEESELAYNTEMILSSIVKKSYQMKATDHLIIQDFDKDPICYLIQESNYRPLPNFVELNNQMKALEKAHTHGFERSWARQYLDKIKNGEIQIDMSKEQNKKLIEKLTTIAQFTDDIMPTKQFLSLNIHYRGGGKDFIDWVYQNYGYLWNTSLRGQEAGYVKALKGFYYEPNQQYYFAGLADGLDSKISNFSVMRKILTNHPDIGHSELMSLMDETFYIRHRQSTVLPFLFKHLREFEKLHGSHI